MTNPTIGSVYNYEGNNYKVTRAEPGKFLVLGADGEWEDGVEFTDHVNDGETATIEYVMSLDDFNLSYVPGEIDEGAAAGELPAGTPPQATQLPADQPKPDNQLPGAAEGQPQPTQYPAGKTEAAKPKK
jgi:hypothetical protein